MMTHAEIDEQKYLGTSSKLTAHAALNMGLTIERRGACWRIAGPNDQLTVSDLFYITFADLRFLSRPRRQKIIRGIYCPTLEGL
jgi:hypothetical protein